MASVCRRYAMEDSSAPSLRSMAGSWPAVVTTPCFVCGVRMTRPSSRRGCPARSPGGRAELRHDLLGEPRDAYSRKPRTRRGGRSSESPRRGVSYGRRTGLMPANLTPDYRAAEAAFRKARDPRERLECLREMLRLIPKHKGTDHLQGDIKRRIKELSEELERPRKGGARSGPALVIRPEGAAQVMLIGPPNTGKSSLHARLTGSGAHAAPYPFTTQHPEPGMMPYEDIHIQLVDLPAVSAEHPVPWFASSLQTSDAALLVVDLGDPACVDQVDALHAVLRERRVSLTDRWEHGYESTAAADADDPFALRLPTLLLANKADSVAEANAEIRAFLEVTGLRYPALAVSATTGY